jgi:hypothetical protein
MINNTINYILIKNKNSFSYTLSLKTNANANANYTTIFLHLLENLIPNSFFYEDENNNKQSIIFTAETVTPLTKEIAKMYTKEMIKCLSEQLEYFYNNNLAFYGFDLDDIIVINDTQFLIVNNKYLQTVDEERKLTFYSPFPKPYFSSPELTELKCLPAQVDYNTCYYSLGTLILYYISADKIPYKNDMKRENLDSNEYIFYTKLYWFLKRCLNENPKKRVLLFL